MINSMGILSLCFGLVMTASERTSSRYRRLALTDDLTGLPNRRFLLEQGGRLSRKAGLYGSTACVLMMDLDHFAEVNKRFGHAGGDTALVAFADLLRQYMRPTDTVARYGGEEFCALLMGTDIEEAAGIAERLREAVAGQGHRHWRPCRENHREHRCRAPARRRPRRLDARCRCSALSRQGSGAQPGRRW